MCFEKDLLIIHFPTNPLHYSCQAYCIYREQQWRYVAYVKVPCFDIGFTVTIKIARLSTSLRRWRPSYLNGKRGRSTKQRRFLTTRNNRKLWIRNDLQSLHFSEVARFELVIFAKDWTTMTIVFFDIRWNYTKKALFRILKWTWNNAVLVSRFLQ